MAKKYIYVKRSNIILFEIIDFLGAIIFGLIGFFKIKKKPFEINKIAVIELTHAGDVLATTPALSLLKKKFPNASIAIVVSPWSKDVVTDNPDIDEVIVYRASWFDRIGKLPFSLTETMAFIRTMRKKHFDLGIDMRGDFRNILLMYLCGIKKRIGYGFAGGSFLLTDIKPFNIEKRQDKHQIEHNLDIVCSIKDGNECYTNDKAFKIYFSESDSDYIERLLRDKGITKNDFLIAIHPGSGLTSKCWPIERFAALMERISKKYKSNIIVIGGSSEKDLVAVLKAASKASFIDAVGKTNIKQLAALLKRCRLFVGGDSGVMHIASAVNTPIVAIWGGHNKMSHWRPLTGDAVVVYKDIECRPCGLAKCDHLRCLKLISVDDVFEGIACQMKRMGKNEDMHD
ncbi:MAG: hypothetical protein COS99_02065 [Candidatus Omnitrophica bacterium CG07_land_8_20_14_0_80_42_15]|uniref:Lipopolysaccharide heptosyltransferase II n=1 Tax=Candidatus Aquitaenariimonas noxiae TaxID=1974741 RepID=A0A2J0KUK1_9BACT|nr:MAG: hypothetical protein COS99_02065 [Candidatus Omnitrophica bacterium CG07_land_8_20_14_0_80_42_15]